MDRSKQRQGYNKKKLSWIYKRKKKLRRAENQTQNEDTNKELNSHTTRIVVRNLPFEIKEEEVRRLYEKYGEIEKIILHSQLLAGCAFIDFKRIQDASKAIFDTNKKEFFGRIITSRWLIENSKLNKKAKNIAESDNKNKSSNPSLKRKNTNQEKEHKLLTLPESNKLKQRRKH